MRIHPSVRQWTLAFVAVDVVLFLLMLGNCALSPVDCLETFTFGSAMQNVLMIPLLSVLPTSTPFALESAAMLLSGAIVHGAIGAGIGYSLRRRRIRPVISMACAATVIVMLSISQLLMAARVGLVD